MMEGSLVTNCREFGDAWSKLLPQMWNFVVSNNEETLERYDLKEVDLAEMEEDMLCANVVKCCVTFN